MKAVMPKPKANRQTVVQIVFYSTTCTMLETFTVDSFQIDGMVIDVAMLLL